MSNITNLNVITMKKRLSFLMTLSLGMFLLFSGAIRLDAQTIIFLTDDNNEAYTVEFLQDQGLNVTTMWSGAHISTWDQADIDALNAADLLIAGRSLNSGEWRDSADRVTWNNLTAPILQLSPYAVRNSRNHWFNSGSAISVSAGAVATAIVPGDAVFDNVTLDGSNQMLWFPYNSNALLHTATDNNGTVIASIGDTIPLLVRWPLTGEPYYVDGPDTAASERVYFGFGIEAYGGLTPQATHFPLTRDAKQVLLAEVCRILGIAQQVAVFDKPYHYDIVFLRDITNTKDDYTVNFIANQGFKVMPFWGDGDVNTWSPDTMAILNNADLVISGRSVNSGNFQDSIERVTWDAVTAPMMYNSPYHVRNSRNHLFNSGSAFDLGLTGETAATAVIPGDGIFDDVTLDGSNMLPWFGRNSNAILYNTGDCNGTIVAQLNDSVPLVVRFDPDIPFYVGGPDSAVAERVYFGFGIEPDEPSHFPLTKDAKQVLLAEISRMLGITSPSSAVFSAPDYTITFMTDYQEDSKDSVQQAWLEAQGFAVNTFWPGSDITTWSQDTLDMLDAAELIIVGRSVGSAESQEVEKRAIWNAITAPLLHNSPYPLRNNRAHWFNTSTIVATTELMNNAEPKIPDDPIFAFASITNDSMDWVLAPCNHLIDLSGDGQGEVVVGIGDTIPLLVRFAADQAFYAGGPDSAVAERIHFAIGEEPGENHFPMTANAQNVYFAEIMRILGGQITAAPVIFGTDKRLAYLGTDKGTMDPAFDADVTSYTVVLGMDEGTIEVSALAGGNVGITGDGVYDLPADNADLTVYVTASSQVGQTTTYSIFIDIDKSDAVEELELDEGFAVYPNPFNSSITISSAEVITNVNVYNLQGALIMSTVTDGTTVTLDLGSLDAGAYIIQSVTDAKTYNHKVVKQ